MAIVPLHRRFRRGLRLAQAALCATLLTVAAVDAHAGGGWFREHLPAHQVRGPQFDGDRHPERAARRAARGERMQRMEGQRAERMQRPSDPGMRMPDPMQGQGLARPDEGNGGGRFAGPGRMTPEERRALRQQINEAGRDVYRAPRP